MQKIKFSCNGHLEMCTDAKKDYWEIYNHIKETHGQEAKMPCPLECHSNLNFWELKIHLLMLDNNE